MNYKICRSQVSDAEEILNLQKLAFQTEAERYNNYNISPLTQTLEEVIQQFNTHVFLSAVSENKIVGTVRACEKDNTCFIGKLAVHPDFRHQGIATALMNEIHRSLKFQRYELFAGSKSFNNIRLYEKLGYVVFKREKCFDAEILYMERTV